MPVNTRHPDYIEYEAQWEMIRDCLKGQAAVKAKGEKYLLKSGGQALQEKKAQACGGKGPYEIAKAMARFPEVLEEARMGYAGLATRVPWEVKNLPKVMEYLLEDAGNGLNVEGWQSKLIAEGLGMGRYALFPDGPKGEKTQRPRIQFYPTESLINWKKADDNTPKLVVFEESEETEANDIFSHDTIKIYRVVRYEESRVVVELWEYDKNTSTDSMREVVEVTYPEMPVVIGGTTENGPDVQRPPLIGIADCAISAYQLSASLRWALRALADPILLALGFSANEIGVLGAGTVLEKDVEPGKASLEYVEFSGEGLQMVVDQIDREIERAEKAGHKMREKSGVEASGTVRQAIQSKTATLKSVDRQAAQAFEDALNIIARMLSLPDQIEVVSAFDYTDDDIEAVTLTAISNAVEKNHLPLKMLIEYVKSRGSLEGVSVEDVVAELEEQKEQQEATSVGLSGAFNDIQDDDIAA